MDDMHQESPRPLTRRQARVLADSSSSETPSFERLQAHEPRQRSRRRLWIALAVCALLLVVVVGAVYTAVQLYGRAMNTRAHLEAAMGEVQGVQQSILAQDSAAATEASTRLAEETSAAVASTQGRLWALAEYVPWIGANLAAVRQVAEVTDDLATDVVAPATTLDLSSLAPRNGRIDVSAIVELSTGIDEIAEGVDRASATVGAIDTDVLIDQVSSGVDRLDGALTTLRDTLSPARDILSVLPAALGAEDPRDYLVMFQGNSEARSLGGNAAVFIVIQVDNGAIAITEHVDSSDFRQPVDEPVVPLDPEAVAIYGDKIGRYTPDFTMIPDFPTATEILDGWWKRDVGTDIDAFISMDPVALSYVLAATGPVQLPTGDTLTADNAVPLLLNEAYFRYEDPLMQNAFFGSAADAVFTALTAGTGSPAGLISALERAASEGRLLYASDDPAEAALVGPSRLSGRMPTEGGNGRLLGVYVNDNTGSKKSYYVDMSITACTGRAQTGARVTLTSSLDESEAARLPFYIAGPNFAKGDISTYVVFYGPVGSTLASIEIDGHEAKVLAQGQHLGRPAVKVEVLNHFVSEHTVEVRFDESNVEAEGVDVWHTPMTRETPVSVSTCSN